MKQIYVGLLERGEYPKEWKMVSLSWIKKPDGGMRSKFSKG